MASGRCWCRWWSATSTRSTSHSGGCGSTGNWIGRLQAGQMRFDVVTLFPGMFAAVTDHGITRRAHELGLWTLATWNPRDFTSDRHRTVDDRPFGGGPGMVLMAEPLAAAVEAARAAQSAAGAGVGPVV